MKCPLLIIGYLSVPDKGVDWKSECLKEGCAWWDELTQRCAIREIDTELRTIATHLLRISHDITD